MRRKNFKLWLLPFLTGATAFQLSGCDPTIKDTLFQGVQTSTVGLMTTFINALFLAIRPATNDTTTTTVRAVIDRMIDTLC